MQTLKPNPELALLSQILTSAGAVNNLNTIIGENVICMGGGCLGVE